MAQRTSPIERFWAKVDKRELDECWEWQGFRDKNGYGRFWYLGGSRTAHRVAWALTTQTSLLKGTERMVCHTCDNPPCCNPLHLFLGTNADNVADKMAKGRYRGAGRGEQNPLAKLTEDQVREIRRLRSTMTQRALARKFGVAQGAIHAVINRNTWKHID